MDEILDKLPDQFNMFELQAKVDPSERTPYMVVAYQECERMNVLIGEIRFVEKINVIKINLDIFLYNHIQIIIYLPKFVCEFKSINFYVITYILF